MLEFRWQLTTISVSGTEAWLPSREGRIYSSRPSIVHSTRPVNISSPIASVPQCDHHPGIGMERKCDGLRVLMFPYRKVMKLVLRVVMSF